MTDERMVCENREITEYVLTHLGGEINRMRNASAEEMHLEWKRHGGEEWSRELLAVQLLLDGVASIDVADSVGLPLQSVRRLRTGGTSGPRKLKTNDAATYVRMRKYYRAGFRTSDGLAAKAHVTRGEAEKYIETCQRSERTKREREAMGADKGVVYRRDSKKWVVEITHHAKSYYGGSFESVEEANSAARQLRERIAHEAADTQ